MTNGPGRREAGEQTFKRDRAQPSDLLILNARHAASDKARWVRGAARARKSLVSLTRIRARPGKPARYCQITTFLVTSLAASKTRRGREQQRE